MRYASFRLHFLSDLSSAMVGWVLDADGREVPDSRVVADGLKINPDKYPKSEEFYLGDLPPVVNP
ncbi:MAG: hypothetical protein ACE5E5_08510 [Phycisphaerae bacterium]